MNSEKPSRPEQLDLAQSIRDACIEAAREGFRDASMSGLCSEGAIEAAIGAMQSLDLKSIIEDDE